MSDSAGFFPDHPFFEGLPQNVLQQIRLESIQRKYLAQQIITYQGDIWPYLFLIESGEINAVKESPEGRVLIATTLRKGDIFWGLAFFIEDAGMPVMLQAASESRVALWPRENLMRVISNNPTLAWRLCQLMIQRMLLASEIVDELAFQPVGNRVAKLLLDEFGDVDDFKPRNLTLKDMAAHTGTTQEMVCRHLYRLEKAGAIEIRRTELRILDRMRLQEIAGKEN